MEYSPRYEPIISGLISTVLNTLPLYTPTTLPIISGTITMLRRCVHGFELLATRRRLLRAQLLHQARVLVGRPRLNLRRMPRAEHQHELVVGHVQELVEVRPAEGELAERRASWAPWPPWRLPRRSVFRFVREGTRRGRAVAGAGDGEGGAVREDGLGPRARGARAAPRRSGDGRRLRACAACVAGLSALATWPIPLQTLKSAEARARRVGAPGARRRRRRASRTRYTSSTHPRGESRRIRTGRERPRGDAGTRRRHLRARA